MDMVNYKKPSKEQKYNLKSNMKTRCYNENYHKTRPDYEECTVCDEWLDDKKLFYEWVDHNFYEIEGEPTVELDKDILVPGNKVYSPDTCIFVPKRINDLFVHIHGRKKEWTTDRSNLFKEDRKVSGYGQRKFAKMMKSGKRRSLSNLDFSIRQKKLMKYTRHIKWLKSYT
ncbi:hypothetical protein M5E86_18495 [Blautia wexlerae]|nr:hypothetical protein M5E86_18495 [Blautia wexlerae]